MPASAPAPARAWRPALALGRAVPEASAIAGLLTRWLGFVFFWAFLALWFQMEGLIGPTGILPAGDLLTAVRQAYPGVSVADRVHRWLLVPSLLWISPGTLAIHLLCAAGLAASVLIMARVYPRWALAVGLICFVSFLSTAQVFASYQSDGMLMTAGVIGLLLNAQKPSWWSLFSLRWLWFTIYFGSGWAKWASGDPEWRHLTALNHYYENGPLPTALGWYAQNLLPHGVEAAIALAILVTELGLVWLCFGPRRARIALFWITTPFQIAIILTANYGFLNWLVLGLGFALLDDRHLDWLKHHTFGRGIGRLRRPAPRPAAVARHLSSADATTTSSTARWSSWVLVALVLITALDLGHRVGRLIPAPERVDAALAPFRVVDPFGLFAVMTRERYEIEFQGSNDGVTWTPYPFRFKPQDPGRAPGWFGPYQPRFDWNLWFASLGTYADNPWVEETEIGLLQGNRAVLGLFAANPFPSPPRAVRAVRWRYWFSTPAQKRQQHIWWTRRQIGLYAPALAR